MSEHSTTGTDSGDATATDSDDEHAATRVDGYLVPADTDADRCPHCGAPFRDEELLALHLGTEHEADLTDEERAVFEDAYEAESEEIRLFRLKALGVLVLLYFGLLIAFSVFG
jgi:hypothetical protein